LVRFFFLKVCECLVLIRKKRFIFYHINKMKETRKDKKTKGFQKIYNTIKSFDSQGNCYPELESMSSLRFSKDQLTDMLKSHISSASLIPIEKYEIDLFEISKEFHSTLRSKPITTSCVEKLHHLHKLVNNKKIVVDIPGEQLSYSIIDIIRSRPLLLSQYNILIAMLDIWNGLLVKWNIGKINNYEYRYSGRGLNVRMLDLTELNKNFFSIDIIWLSTQIFDSPLNGLADPQMIECGKILNNQLEVAMATFLDLNPRIVDPDFKIRNAVAFYSESYRKWTNEECPEPNLSNYKHKELKIYSGFSKCFWSNDQKIEGAKKKLEDLEMAYRVFEKRLIARILNKTGRAKF